MIELTETLAADALRLMFYLPVKDECSLNLSTMNIKEIVQIIRKSKKTKIKLIYPCFLPSDFDFSSLNSSTIIKENNFTVGCGAGIVNCVLNTDGSLAPCDLLSEIEKSPVITEPEDIETIWNNDSLFIKWRNLKLKGSYCINCCYNSICGKGCRASVFLYNKDLESDDEICLLRGYNE